MVSVEDVSTAQTTMKKLNWQHNVRGGGGRIAFLPETWKAATLEAPGNASRTNCDLTDALVSGVRKALAERCEIVEKLRVVAAALKHCRSSIGLAIDAIVDD